MKMSRFKRESNIEATGAWMKKWNSEHADVGSAPVQPQPQRAQAICVHILQEIACMYLNLELGLQLRRAS